MARKLVYIFSGEFADRQQACRYSQEQWEPEPDPGASKAAYQAWEDRNPSHALRTNLNSWLDADFIETVETNFEYLLSILSNHRDLDTIKRLTPASATYFVLVFEAAICGDSKLVSPVSTPELRYIGCYPSQF